MSRLAPTLFAAAALLIGCAVPKVSPGTMMARADEDVLSALAEYKDKKLSITGAVTAKGLAKRTRLVGGVNEWTGEISAQRVAEDVPVLGLEPQSRIQCFFDLEELEAVAAVKVGQTVTLVCRFYSFTKQQGVQVATFGECSIE